MGKGYLESRNTFKSKSEKKKQYDISEIMFALITGKMSSYSPSMVSRA